MSVRTALVVVVAASIALATGGAAQAGFVTVGVYDPASVNDVDQSGVFDTATGSAGAGNVMDLAGFQALIGSAFTNNMGGVVEFENTGALEAGGGSFIADYGTSGTKSLTINSGNSAFVHPGYTTDNRVPVSGTVGEMLSKTGEQDFSFNIGAIAGGIPQEGVTHFGVTAIERDGADQGDLHVTATFSSGSMVTAKAAMTGGAPSNDEDTFFGFVAPAGERIVNVFADFNDSSDYMNVDDVAFITGITDASVTSVIYRQPFFSASGNSPHSAFNWTALVETTAGSVIDYVHGVDGVATGVAASPGSPNTPDPVNALTEVPGPTDAGYGYYAPRTDTNVPTGAGSLHFTGDVPDVDISTLVSVLFESKNDNEDAEMRLALKIGSQWYASALDFGYDGDEDIWTGSILSPTSFEAAANWRLLDVVGGPGGQITVGAPPTADLAGTVTDFGLFIDAGYVPSAGDHARFDNFTVSVADVIPEPTTIALLVLGGLLTRLRRRRA